MIRENHQFKLEQQFLLFLLFILMCNHSIAYWEKETIQIHHLKSHIHALDDQNIVLVVRLQ